MAHRIEIDVDLCSSYGECVDVAPEVFQLNEEDLSYVVDPKGADDETVREAAEACPVNAIALYDPDSGEKIFPR